MVAILAHESVHAQHCGRVEYVSQFGGAVKCINECSLVLYCSRLIELIGLLEPRARIVEVQMKRVLRARLKGHPVEHIFRVSLCMAHLKLWGIEKAAGLKAVRGYE